MAKLHVALASQPEHKFTGSIKLPGMTPFYFNTKAVSDKQAKNNGVAQFARKLNMSVANLQRHMKDYKPKIDISMTEEAKPPKEAKPKQPKPTKVKIDHEEAPKAPIIVAPKKDNPQGSLF
jgi:hypothetical protein